jgi:hypothetical protein
VQGATKDVAALKDKFKGLEQKLMELQQRLDAKEKENARLKEESQRQAYVVRGTIQRVFNRTRAPCGTLCRYGGGQSDWPWDQRTMTRVFGISKPNRAEAPSTMADTTIILFVDTKCRTFRKRTTYIYCGNGIWYQLGPVRLETAERSRSGDAFPFFGTARLRSISSLVK